MADARDDRSADEIRRDIEGTRAEMHETVDALERKLSPGQLLDEVWGRVRGSGGGDGAASAVGDVIRDHPLPLALMGLGVAWLAVEKATGSEGDRLRGRHGEVGPGTYGRAEGRVGPYRGDAISGDEHGSALETAKDKASSAVDAVKGKASELKGKASSSTADARAAVQRAASEGRDWTSEAGDRAGEQLQRAKREARSRAGQAKRGLWSAMDEQPLAMGAVAFGLGLASGLSVPTTRAEDELMGHASETVKHEAKETAKEVGESAQRVAGDAVRAARDEADRQGVGPALKQSASRIASEAKQAAKERADREGLHAEGMKDRASDAADHVQDRARDDRPSDQGSRDAR